MQLTTIAGNVGKDAVLRRTGNGDAVLGFSVAVDNGKDKNGTKRDSTWFSCSLWGKRGESLEKGTLKLSVNELTFMGGGSQEPAQRQDQPVRDDLNDEIPF